MAIKFLSGQTIDGTLTVSGNVQGATFNGLAINTTGLNNVADQIVRTQANGYAKFGWIKSTSGNHTGAITRITASNDEYLRYVTPAQFRTGVTDGYYAPVSTVSGVTSISHGNGITATPNPIISTGTLTMSGSYTGTFTATSLAGTTATFADSVAIGGVVVANRNLAIYNTNAGNELEFIGADYTNIYSNTNSTMAVEVIGDGALRLATKGGNLTIATGGSSTFSGTVTAAGGTMTSDTTFNSNIILEGNIYHKDDTNTYFGFNPGTSTDDTIVFTTAGSERMRITDYGSLVVNNTPGTNVNWGRIQCGGTITVGNSSGTYNAHGRISGDSTSGLRLIGSKSGTYTTTSGITIASSRVGINEIDPAALLHIKGTGDAIRVKSTNTGSGGAQIDLLHYSTSPADNDTMAYINMGGYYNTTPSQAYFSSIRTVATDISARKGELTFWTINNTLQQRMVIDTDGNVGIGVTTPNYLLDLSKTAVAIDTYSGINLQASNYGYTIEGGLTQNIGGELIFSSNSVGTKTPRVKFAANGNVEQGTVGTTASAYYYFNATTGGDTGIIFRDNASTNSGFLTYNHSIDAMKFATGGSERMRITSSGLIQFPVTSTTAVSAGTIRHASNNFLYVSGGTGGGSFGDKDHGTRMIAFNNDYLRFDTQNSEKFRIAANGSTVQTMDSTTSLSNLWSQGVPLQNTWYTVYTYSLYDSVCFFAMVSFENDAGDGANQSAMFATSAGPAYGGAFGVQQISGGTGIEARRSSTSFQVRQTIGAYTSATRLNVRFVSIN